MNRQDSLDSLVSIDELMDELYNGAAYVPPARQLYDREIRTPWVDGRPFPIYGLHGYGRNTVYADRVPDLNQVTTMTKPVDQLRKDFVDMGPLTRIEKPPEGIPADRKYAHGKGAKKRLAPMLVPEGPKTSVEAAVDCNRQLAKVEKELEDTRALFVKVASSKGQKQYQDFINSDDFNNRMTHLDSLYAEVEAAKSAAKEKKPKKQKKEKKEKLTAENATPELYPQLSLRQLRKLVKDKYKVRGYTRMSKDQILSEIGKKASRPHVHTAGPMTASMMMPQF